MRQDRPYQARAKEGVRKCWQEGVRSVCLVAPTGAGKTHMGSSLALEGGGTVLWSAHRTELVSQAYSALHSQLDGASMGVIAPGHHFVKGARVQVSSTQTLLKRGRPDVSPSVIVLDESHHYVAPEFRILLDWWPEARILGPTATPQRGDGRPLNEGFQSLVVAAQYSELIEDGFLCDAVCYQPEEALQGALALDPAEAWIKYSGGGAGFAFMPSIKAARELVGSLGARGVRAAAIDAKTPKAERKATLESFASGDIDVICNVDTMTEGVDIPRASVCLLARSFQTVGAYLQACGRVLRPHASKQYARIIDLTGATLIHLPPTIDRAYALDGDGIRPSEGADNPVRNCHKCGKVYLCELSECDGCGAPPKPRVRKPPRIFSLELQEQWAGEYTKEDVKMREYKRLRTEQKNREFGLDWVVEQYQKSFGSKPKMFDVTPQEKRIYFKRKLAEGQRLGKSDAYAAARFKGMFGHWPAGKMVN